MCLQLQLTGGGGHPGGPPSGPPIENLNSFQGLPAPYGPPNPSQPMNAQNFVPHPSLQGDHQKALSARWSNPWAKCGLLPKIAQTFILTPPYKDYESRAPRVSITLEYAQLTLIASIKQAG